MPGREEQAKKFYEEGRGFLHQKKFEKSVLAFQQAMQYFLEAGNLYMYARTINTLGVSYSIAGNETMAVDCFLNGLDFIEKYHIKGVAHLFYNNIGTRYQELGDDKTALEYFLKAEEDCLANVETNDEMAGWYVVSYLNIGLIYWHLKDYVNAEMNLIKAREYAANYHVTDYDFPMSIILTRIYYSMGNKEYAKEHLDELMAYASDEIVNLVDYAQDIMEMVDLLLEMEEYDRLLQVIRILEAVSKKQDNVHISMQVVELYMRYYKAIGDEEAYVRACVEHAQVYEKVRKVSDQEKILALNVKIALHESERTAEEAKQKSERDALTGLQNRYAMQKVAVDYVEKAQNEHSKLLAGILDIDCFKQYNDTYGHLQGDEVLKHIANILYDAVDGYGEVFRFGGDEFLILVPNANRKTAEKVAERIGNGLQEKPMENRNSYVSPLLTVSHGYYLAVPQNGQTLEYFIDKADTALYEVKKHGRNRYGIDEA